MMKKCYVLNDEIINVGDWDYQKYINEEGKEVVGNPLPYEAVQVEKDMEYSEDRGWYEVSLEKIKQEKLIELNQSYVTELTSGFTSNGVRFKYAEIDQLNFTKRINAIALGTSDGTFYFGTADGVKQFTIDDFKIAAKDAEIHEMTVYGKLESLRQQIIQATTREEVEAIVW